MKNLMKKLIVFLLAILLFTSVTPYKPAGTSDIGITVAGDEEDVIDLSTLIRT
ncbi:MAG: hypothetical protein J6J44_11440 [Lachnospiraceae bacterium]|nr:hypothetical protein [Lachnospiraceae bacterium]